MTASETGRSAAGKAAEPVPGTIPSTRMAPFIAALALLTAATWLTGIDELRFADATPIAFGTGFPGAPDDWDLDGRRSEIRFDATTIRFRGTAAAAGAGSAYRIIDLDPADASRRHFLDVRGRVTSERAPSALPAERSAAFLVWFQDERGDPFDYRTVGLLRDARSGGSLFERTVAVPERARHLIVALVGRDSDGSFTLSEVRVDRYTLARAYASLRIALIAGWLILVGVVLAWMFRRSPWLVASSVAVPLALTFIGVLAPEGLNGPLTAAVEERLSTLLEHVRLTPAELLFKGGHFVAFLTLATSLFAFRARLRASTVGLGGALALLAVGTEGAQLHLVDRTTRMSDIAVDLSAVLCALLLVRSIEFLRRPVEASS